MEEARWVATIEDLLAKPQRSVFLTVLHARWTAAPFQTMLRVREVSNAVDEEKRYIEALEKGIIADIATHGLHACGLPSCKNREATVKQFKYCGDCEEEWYCCAKHQVALEGAQAHLPGAHSRSFIGRSHAVIR